MYPLGRAPDRRRTRRCLEPSGEVPHVLHMGRKLLRRTLVHRYVVNRGRRAAVVLEQQVLGHHVLLWCGTRPVVAMFTAETEPRAGSRHCTATFPGGL